jgi:hypothetical protein
MEALIAPLRRAAFSKQAQAAETEDDPDHIEQPPPATSPPPTSMRTPAKTPMAHVTNSLVNGTPFRQAPSTTSRFSPLKFLNTPGARQPSGLRSVSADEDEDRAIFGRGKARSTLTPAQPRSVETTPPVAAQEDDDTIRFPATTIPKVPTTPSPKPASPIAEPADETPRVSPVEPKPASPEKGPRKIAGVEIDLESVGAATVCFIESCMVL